MAPLRRTARELSPNAFSRLFAYVGSFRRAYVVSFAVLLVCGIALLDTRLNPLLSLSVVFLVPVLIAGSRDRLSGVLVAVVAVVARIALDTFRPEQVYEDAAVPVANSVMQLLVFLTVVGLLDELRRQVHHEANLARVDATTGLLNQRGFWEVAEAARLWHARYGRPLTLAYIDIDGMKTINDRFGHAAGDAVIAAAGGALARSVRAVDTPAHLHGDEFAVLLPETDVAQAEQVLRRTHRQLSRGGPAAEFDAGYSIGAVTFRSEVGSVEDMLTAADKVMYGVKQGGKGAIQCVAA